MAALAGPGPPRVNQAQRQIRIRELLEDREFVDLETLCRELGASESSVRRDLVHLEKTGVVKRVHGGALAVQPRGHLLDYNWQRDRQTDEKHRIGAARRVADRRRPDGHPRRRLAPSPRWPSTWPTARCASSPTPSPIVQDPARLPQHRRDADRRVPLPAPGDRARAAVRAHAGRRGRRRAGDGHRRRDGGRLQQQQHPARRLRAEDDRGLPQGHHRRRQLEVRPRRR